MINPANHAKSPESIAVYKVEPYVMAADVYAVAPHTGRGGWTWYTGSAGWMYRLIIESLLGLRLEIDKLHITPCLPAHWTDLTIHYRFRETVYHIEIQQSPCAAVDKSEKSIKVIVDGLEQCSAVVPLTDDHQEHQVKVSM